MEEKKQNDKFSKAVALAYEQNSRTAPKVLAKGKGAIADKIIEKAKEYDIPLFASAALVDSLLEVELEQEIPPELYRAVVEVFVWLYNNEQKAQRS